MRFVFAVLTAAALFLSACGAAVQSSVTAPTFPVSETAVAVPKTPNSQQPTSASSAVLFQVVKVDGTSFGISWDDLKKLPLANLTVDGKVEEGPRLADVLKAAGVTDFSEVTLTGSASPATLTRAQVDDNTILDFNNHGTVKLASTYIPKADWTKDVSEIKVK